MSDRVWKADIGTIDHDGRVDVNFASGERVTISGHQWVRGLNFSGMRLDRGGWRSCLGTAKREAAAKLREIAAEVNEHARDLETEGRACETA